VPATSGSATSTDRCDVCGDGAYRSLFWKRGWQFVRCQSCGHVYVRLGLTDQELREAYATNFFSDGAYVDYVRDRPILEKNFRRYITLLREHSDSGFLLEVGCAYGFFLALARSQWQVRGVDINSDAVAYAQDRLALDVTCEDFLSISQGDATCDVVTLWDTIEHLRSPSAYIARIARLLKPGGIVALTTGDVGSLAARVLGRRWRLYYPPFHLHYFSRRTMTRLLEQHGLRVEAIKPFGFYRSVDLMLYRLFVYERPRRWGAVYHAASWAGLTQRDLYLNLFDIMLVVARKPAD
jgi:SAM-dependent methyltransferase